LLQKILKGFKVFGFDQNKARENLMSLID